MISTSTVNSQLYTDAAARNWLSIRDCGLTWTDLGELLVAFSSEEQRTQFFSQWPQYQRGLVTVA